MLLETAHCFLQQKDKMDSITETASTVSFNVFDLLQSNWKAAHR